MGNTAIRCSSEENRLQLIWYVCDSNGYLYHIISYQDKGQATYSIPLDTRVVDSLMQVIRTIQMLLNTSCYS